MATLGVLCDTVAFYTYNEITHDHNFIIHVDFSQNVSKIRVKTVNASLRASNGWCIHTCYRYEATGEKLEAQCHRYHVVDLILTWIL